MAKLKKVKKQRVLEPQVQEKEQVVLDFEGVESFADIAPETVKVACVSFAPTGGFASNNEHPQPYGIVEDTMLGFVTTAQAIDMKYGPEYEFAVSKDSKVDPALRGEYARNRKELANTVINTKIDKLYSDVLSTVMRKVSDWLIEYIGKTGLPEQIYDELFMSIFQKVAQRSYNSNFTLMCNKYNRRNAGSVTDVKMMPAIKANPVNVEILYNDFLINRIPNCLLNMYDIIHTNFTQDTAILGTGFDINGLMDLVSTLLLEAKEYMSREVWNIIMSTIAVQEATAFGNVSRSRRDDDYYYDDECDF